MRWILVVGLLLCALASATAAQSTRWDFKGYELTAIYTLPVPPGQTAQKNRVKVAAGIANYQLARQEQDALRLMLADMAGTFAEADPFRGWAPFVYGTELRPIWVQVPVP